MRVRGRGGILNLASLGGYAPGPYQAAYYASKAYVLSLTRSDCGGNSRRRRAGLRPGAGPGQHPIPRARHARQECHLSQLLVPPASATAVARAGYLGYVLGLRVVSAGAGKPVPGTSHAHLAA